MADDKTRKGPQDANRISLSEDYEVQYWTNRFSVSRAHWKRRSRRSATALIRSLTT
ncbi:DUF3606 domain-containing protein [Sphingobium chungangianum]|jgi:hypothetical protein